eukprot:16439291-Heterocapsa_arctica.AAC.1
MIVLPGVWSMVITASYTAAMTARTPLDNRILHNCKATSLAAGSFHAARDLFGCSVSRIVAQQPMLTGNAFGFSQLDRGNVSRDPRDLWNSCPYKPLPEVSVQAIQELGPS